MKSTGFEYNSQRKFKVHQYIIIVDDQVVITIRLPKSLYHFVEYIYNNTMQWFANLKTRIVFTTEHGKHIKCLNFF